MAPVWVMTRAQPDADQDVATLRAEGIEAVAVPCIERVALPWPVSQANVVLVSSSFGAMELVKAWPTLDPKPLVAAMAPATAARLEQEGIPVGVRAEGGIVALATALRSSRSGSRDTVLYATSDAGIEQPEQTEALAILRTVATVERVAVYTTRAPAGLDAQLKALTAPASFAFMSPSAVEQALPRLAIVPSAVACIGQSTLRRYAELAANPVATHYPSFGAFVTALTKERP